MNAIKLFLRYNTQLVEILGVKSFWFMLILIFSTILSYSIAALTTNFNILPFFLSVLLDSLLSITITYCCFASNTELSDIKKEFYGLIDFIKEYYPMVFLSQLLFGVICFIGLSLLILPGILALFFLPYCYFFVMLEGKSPVESIILSYQFVKKIWQLQLAASMAQLFAVFCLIIVTSLGNVILIVIMQNMVFMYYTLINLIIFVDNKKLR